ncbi:MAG TPA: hypothetical protein VEI02_15300, partial [Planctomycetota bacterium]|nr:hypothetical protein [Planctomycetota bacterium]
MPSPRLLRIALAAACWASPAAGQESRPESSPARWRSLAADLDSDVFERRERAMRELAEAGESARDALTDAKTTASLEARLRIEELLGLLGARSAGPRPARRASVELADGTLSEGCARLATAFGVRVRPATPQDGALRASFSADDLPFFAALDRLCDAAGAAFYRDARDGAYLLRRGDRPGPVVYADGLRAELIQMSVTRTARFGAGATLASAHVQLQIDV